MSTKIVDPREELNFVEEDQYVNEDVAFNYLSLDILKDNVSEQINGLGNLEMVTTLPSLIPIRVNYLDKFKSRYNSVLEIIDKDDSNLVESLSTCKNEFYNYILKLLFTKFKLNFVFNFTYTTIEEKMLYIEALYKYFVIDIEDTLVNYIVNNMITNSNSIIKSMKAIVNKKDMTFNMYKKELNNADYAVLIYSVESYMESLEKDSIEGFIEDSLSMKDEPIEGYRELIKDLFLNDTENLIDDLSFSFSEIKNILKYIIDNSTSTILRIKTSLFDFYKNLD